MGEPVAGAVAWLRVCLCAWLIHISSCVFVGVLVSWLLCKRARTPPCRAMCSQAENVHFMLLSLLLLLLLLLLWKLFVCFCVSVVIDN